jgi:hypothetical protein
MMQRQMMQQLLPQILPQILQRQMMQLCLQPKLWLLQQMQPLFVLQLRQPKQRLI